MDIEYLKTYFENRNNLKGSNAKGMTLAEIETLELEMNKGKPFPKALREFLFIGGLSNKLGLNTPTNYRATHDYFDKEIRKRGVDITQPYFVLDNDNDGKTYTIIYLNEGDNPQPWNASINEGYDNDIWEDEDENPENWKLIEMEMIWKMPYSSFSEFIDKAVYLAVNRLSS